MTFTSYEDTTLSQILAVSENRMTSLYTLTGVSHRSLLFHAPCRLVRSPALLAFVAEPFVVHGDVALWLTVQGTLTPSSEESSIATFEKVDVGIIQRWIFVTFAIILTQVAVEFWSALLGVFTVKDDYSASRSALSIEEFDQLLGLGNVDSTLNVSTSIFERKSAINNNILDVELSLKKFAHLETKKN